MRLPTNTMKMRDPTLAPMSCTARAVRCSLHRRLHPGCLSARCPDAPRLSLPGLPSIRIARNLIRPRKTARGRRLARNPECCFLRSAIESSASRTTTHLSIAEGSLENDLHFPPAMTAPISTPPSGDAAGGLLPSANKTSDTATRLLQSLPMDSVWAIHALDTIQAFALPIAFWFKPVCVCVALFW